MCNLYQISFQAAALLYKYGKIYFQDCVEIPGPKNADTLLLLAAKLGEFTELTEKTMKSVTFTAITASWQLPADYYVNKRPLTT